MKTGFKNPIEPREGKSVSNPWNFEQPAYDERSSCYVNAGTYYGVGKKQPVGTNKVSMKGEVPKGKVDTMPIYNEDYKKSRIL